MALLFVAKVVDGVTIPVKGLESIEGESSAAFRARGEALAATMGKEYSCSQVFQRFSSIRPTLLGRAWGTSVESKESTLQACERFAIPTKYIAAWASACRAANPDGKLFPTAPAAGTGESSKTGLNY